MSSSALSKGLTGNYDAGETGWATSMDNNLSDINNWLLEQWAADRPNIAGLTYAYKGGTVLSGGVYSLVAAGTIALTDNATNYVERTPGGTVSKNTSGFSATKIPMAKVTTVSGAITAIVDQRFYVALPNADVFGVPMIVGDGVNAITTGYKGHIKFPFACKIIASELAADAAGSIVLDLWKGSYANLLPTVADTITASAKPTLSTALKSTDSTLTGWTVDIAAGDYIGWNVDSATTVKQVTHTLTCRRT